jgi:hypothetical protein
MGYSHSRIARPVVNHDDLVARIESLETPANSQRVVFRVQQRDDLGPEMEACPTEFTRSDPQSEKECRDERRENLKEAEQKKLRESPNH